MNSEVKNHPHNAPKKKITMIIAILVLFNPKKLNSSLKLFLAKKITNKQKIKIELMLKFELICLNEIFKAWQKQGFGTKVSFACKV